jgi:AraC-like DNA-binding protein
METVASYREFQPCQELRPHVRAFFSFTTMPSRQLHGRRAAREILFRDGQPFWSRLFADGHVSLVFSLGSGYSIQNLWHPRSCGPAGHVIGTMDRAQATSCGEDLTQVGAYFRAGTSLVFTGVPASELTGRVIAISDLWGHAATIVEDEIRRVSTEADRVDWLERALLDRVRKTRIPASPLNVLGLAESAVIRRGRVSVSELAASAGVSRQYLTRVFRENIGVTPKLYCRLARFQAALAHAASGEGTDWAAAAAETGYADQSHMIAEFRQFGGVTPERLATERQFHPFVSKVRDE